LQFNDLRAIESAGKLGENALSANLRPYTTRSINDRYLRIPAGWNRREAAIAGRGCGARQLGKPVV